MSLGYDFLKAKPTGLELPIVTVSIEEEIRQSLLLCLLTQKGERPLSPEFGSILREMIFDTRLAHLDGCLAQIKTDLQASEPRAEIGELEFIENGEHGAILKVVYVIRSSSHQQFLFFPLKALE